MEPTRYILTIRMMVDCEPESLDEKITALSQGIVEATKLPVKIKSEMLPSSEELKEMSAEEFDKWVDKMPV